MKSAPKGKEFYFVDGNVVNTIPKLRNYIKKLNPENYSYHVNQEKNDFYNWIYYCIDKRAGNTIKGNIPQKAMLDKLARMK